MTVGETEVRSRLSVCKSKKKTLIYMIYFEKPRRTNLLVIMHYGCGSCRSVEETQINKTILNLKTIIFHTKLGEAGIFQRVIVG